MGTDTQKEYTAEFRQSTVSNILYHVLERTSQKDAFQYMENVHGVVLASAMYLLKGIKRNLESSSRLNWWLKKPNKEEKNACPKTALIEYSNIVLDSLLSLSKETLKSYVMKVPFTNEQLLLKHEVGYPYALNNVHKVSDTRRYFGTYTKEFVQNSVIPILNRTLSYVEKYIETRRIYTKLEGLIKEIYVDYIARWNKSDYVLKLKPTVAFTLDRDTGGYNLTLYTAFGRKIIVKDRNVSHWVIDGSLHHSSNIMHNILRRNEQFMCFKNPTQWITLDNYQRFVSKSVRIDLIDQELLDPTEDIKGLCICLGNQKQCDATHLFYKRTEEGYKYINSNQKEAAQWMKRMELMKRLSK